MVKVRLTLSSSMIVLGVFLLVTVFSEHIAMLGGIYTSALAEVFIIIILSLAAMLLLFQKNLPKQSLHILILVCLTFSISLFKNGFLVASLGTFFLFKSLICFFVGLFLVTKDSSVRSTLRGILFIALLSSVYSIVEYHFGLDLIGHIFNLKDGRIGAKGLFFNANQNGLVMVCGFTYVLFVSEKSFTQKLCAALVLLYGISLTGSFQSLGATLFVVAFFALKKMKSVSSFIALLPIIIIPIAAVYAMGLYGDRIESFQRAFDTGEYFRFKALIISFQILSENWLLGTGAGTFGGAIAGITDSPIHAKYNIWSHWVGYENRPTTIDMYWPHAWAELGVCLTLYYIYILMRIIIPFIKQKLNSQEADLVCVGCLLIVICITSLINLSMETAFVGLLLFFLAGLSQKRISKKGRTTKSLEKLEL